MPDSTSREIVPEMDRYLNWIHSGSGKKVPKVMVNPPIRLILVYHAGKTLLVIYVLVH